MASETRGTPTRGPGSAPALSLSPVIVGPSRAALEEQERARREGLSTPQRDMMLEIPPPFSPYRNDGLIFGSGSPLNQPGTAFSGRSASAYGSFYREGANDNMDDGSSQRHSAKKRVSSAAHMRGNNIHELMQLGELGAGRRRGESDGIAAEDLGSSFDEMSTLSDSMNSRHHLQGGQPRVKERITHSNVTLRDDAETLPAKGGVRRFEKADTPGLLDMNAPVPPVKAGKLRVERAPVSTFSLDPNKDMTRDEGVRPRDPSKYSSSQVREALANDGTLYAPSTAGSERSAASSLHVNHRVTGGSLGQGLVDTREEAAHTGVKNVSKNLAPTKIFFEQDPPPQPRASAVAYDAAGRPAPPPNRSNLSSNIGSVLDQDSRLRYVGRDDLAVSTYGFIVPPLGLQNGDVTSKQISVSSEYSRETGGQGLRLRGESAWVASQLNHSQYAQVDLDEICEVHGVCSQGAPFMRYQYWVTSFRVCYADEDRWKFVLDPSTGKDMVFKGNKDCSEVVANTFPQPVRTQFIRIYPTSWNNGIGLRLEVYGTRLGSSQREPKAVEEKDKPVPYSHAQFVDPASVKQKYDPWLRANPNAYSAPVSEVSYLTRQSKGTHSNFRFGW